MRALFVLIWKHYLVRKRRFIHTPVEFLSPIIYFVILFANKDNLVPVRSFDTHNEVKNTESFTIESVRAPGRVLYTPSTELTDTLMDAVGPKLHLSRLDHLPRGKEKGYFPFSDASSIVEYSKNMPATDAIIIFHNLNNSWPKKLEYTIRMKNSFNTHMYEPVDGTLGPHDTFGTMYETFMRLQWCLDTSYLHLLTGAEINQTLTLQEFPYSKAAENSAVLIVCSILELVCPLALVLVFVFLMARLLEEKNSGIQELVKMVGVSTESLCASHFVNALPGGVVYACAGAALLTATSHPFFPNSSAFLIFLMLLLHFTSVLALAFFFAYLINTTQHITSVCVFVYLFAWLPSRWLTVEQTLPVLLSGLLPHTPLAWCWRQLAAREQYGRGLTLMSIAETASRQNGSVLTALALMLVQTGGLLLLGWYLTLVRPGAYGQPLPWNFLFQRQYWSKNPKVETYPSEESHLSNPDPQFFEPVPKGRVAGIQIVGVSKAFPKHTALSDVTFDVLQGEITVLLGHNGAGKTTLMNIITGLMAPTSGRVLVNGLDTCSQRAAVRSQLGLCPQHNLFFPDLTVLEHVMFFALLKGDTCTQARSSSENLLQKLKILDKAHSRTDELSGGMKRRVQLACALAGGASVLVLDEPTSGLDVETRRELWDILLNLRGDRTVLLTTHFMEEADALGDRVAALHAGHLKCHATTMFLKRAVGTGYRVSLTTIGAPAEPAITGAVRAVVPDATIRDQAMNSLSYNLPAKDCARFPDLFASLEENRSKLGIDSIGVGKSTLDEVFLRLCSDVQTSFEDDHGDATDPEITLPKLVGFHLYLRQFSLLLMRQYFYIMSKKLSFFILQVFLPIVFIVFVTSMMNEERQDMTKHNAAAVMNLDLYTGMTQKRVLYNIQYDSVLPVLKDAYKKVQFDKTTDVAESVLEAARIDILEYNKYLVGIELNDTDAKALFTTTVRHAAPVAVNLLTNALAARLAAADGRAIVASNQPISGAYDVAERIRLVEPKSQITLLLWAFYVSFAILAVLGSNTTLPSRERVSGTRHIHLMSGCPAALHWATTLFAHVCCALVFLIVPTLIATILLDKDRTIDQPGFLGALTMSLFLGVPAFLAPAYAISLGLAERVTSAFVFVAIVVFGFITPSIQITEESLQATGLTYSLVVICSYALPPHTLTLALVRCASLARTNALCALNRARCPSLPVAENGFDVAKCCESSSDFVKYFSLDEAAPGRQWLILIAQFVVYWILLLVAERGVFGKVRDRVLGARLARHKPRFNDPVVRAEHAYVEKAIQLPKKQISEAILCHNVHKYYPGIFKKSCFAVKGISFSVKKGECFGLLGVNGAGKSTTFKMLTGELRPTRGSLFANQHYFEDTTQYMRSLSYCPQFFGLDEFLTGRQNLELVLTLRGLDAASAGAAADSWIREVGLESYASRPVSSYSGGCARRLAAAAAMCQHSAAALLDEPTAGVDAAARRRLHRAMRRAAKRSALVVASHSMDEMEALCDRIGIMSGGELCALGSAGALRAQHAAGHALVLKLRAADVTDGGGPDAISEFKGALHKAFDCALRDEHQTMLHYHVKDAVRYSELFARVEALRSAHAILEDYSVSETTLEEVFLSFARDAQCTDV